MLLTLSREGAASLVLTRRLDAPPARVWQALTQPPLLTRWMTGPPGWPMLRCQIAPRAGGLLHFEWSDRLGRSLVLTGEVIEVDAPWRMLHVERLHLPDPAPETVVETLLAADEGGTRLMLHMTFPDAGARDDMLSGGLAEGMEDSYVRLESLLAGLG